MILEKGDMWDAFGKGIFMITTNPIRRKDGAVVMGRGIALQAKTKYPQLPFDFGERLVESEFRNIGMIGEYDNVPVWWFMVKDHWANNADLMIINQSVELLQHIKKDIRVDLNFPGIGNGKLKKEDVLPLLEDLPDNIHVWEFK